MKRIFKYDLSAVGFRSPIQVPIGSVALSVQVQFGIPALYVQVPVHVTPVGNLWVTGVLTGGEVPTDAGDYIGTAMLNDGAFVKHFYVNHTEVAHV